MFKNHPSIQIIENEDCTADWLALNAPDYYGFVPSKDLTEKIVNLMHNIQNPNEVIWHGFDVVLDELGDFKYAKVKNKNQPKELEKPAEDGKEEKEQDKKAEEKPEIDEKEAETENLEVVEELPQEEGKEEQVAEK